jgi:hypothetical protein
MKTTVTSDAGGSRIENVADPINDQDAATKKYVDDNIPSGVLLLDQTTPQNVTAGSPIFEEGIYIGWDGASVYPVGRIRYDNVIANGMVLGDNEGSSTPFIELRGEPSVQIGTTPYDENGVATIFKSGNGSWSFIEGTQTWMQFSGTLSGYPQTSGDFGFQNGQSYRNNIEEPATPAQYHDIMWFSGSDLKWKDENGVSYTALTSGNVGNYALLLDQTTPQTILNGVPIFTDGLAVGDGVSGQGGRLSPLGLKLGTDLTGGGESIWLHFDRTANVTYGDPNFQANIRVAGINDNAETPLLSIDPNTRQLLDTTGIDTVDWENCVLDSNIQSSPSIDWANRILYAPDGTTQYLNWTGVYDGVATLLVHDTGIQLNATSFITDAANGYNSISPNDRTLYASDGTTPMLDWSGASIAGYVEVAGINGDTSILTGGTINMNLATLNSLDGMPTVDWVSKKLWSASWASVDWGNGYLIAVGNPDDTTSVDWNNRILWADGTTKAVDWTGQGWGAGYLQSKGMGADPADALTVSFLDLVAGTVSDYNGSTYLSADFQGRFLYANDGTTKMVEWTSYDLLLRGITNYGVIVKDNYFIAEAGIYADSPQTLSIESNDRYLYDTDGTTIVAKWGNGDGTLTDGSDNPFLTAETDPVVGAVTGIVKSDGAGNISGITDNSSNWDAAYGWGDHSTAGYAAASTTPVISTGTSAPGTTPSKVGDIYVDTANAKVYVATGTSSSSDWTVLN